MLKLLLLLTITGCGAADYDVPDVIQKITPGEPVIMVNTSHPYINWALREVFKHQGRKKVMRHLITDTQINTLKTAQFETKYDKNTLGITETSEIVGLKVPNTTQITIKTPEHTLASRNYIGLILAHEMRHAMGEDTHAECIPGKINYFYPQLATSPTASDNHLQSKILIQSLYYGDTDGYLNIEEAFSLAEVPLTNYLYSQFICSPSEE